ncbi:MAG: protein phosphatase 2C domain-containing protein [Gammaproteobacteria bacterium]
MQNPLNFQWQSATRTHVGLVRRINEDSILDRADAGLWVVADGMGGHAAGDVASQLIVDTLRRVEPSASLSDYVNRVEDALLSVNLRLVSMSAQTQQTSGSTVVALIAFRNLCVVIWAGDSRAYRLRNGKLQQLSNDHSHIEMYVEQGLITREEAAMHPAGNLITRAVGAAPELCLEMDLSEMAEGDRYLLSSDGLDKHVMQDEIANLLGAKGSPDEIAQKLIETTLQRGAADNVSVAVIDIQRASS